MEHPTNECSIVPSSKEVLHDQPNATNMVKKIYYSPYSETYNPGWGNHPNFSWRNDNTVAPLICGSNFFPYNPSPRRVL